MINTASGSGEAEDFYNELTPPAEMGSTTIKQYMENWLLQMNYPLVTVQLDNTGTGSIVEFYQDRFYYVERDLLFDSDPVKPNPFK